MNQTGCSLAKSARVALPLLITLLCASISTSQSPAPAETNQVTVQTGVRVKMRDGVQLIADVYRPRASGKFPVLLTRTPYNRRDFNTGMYLASHGYVAILQDTRGRFDSDGEFYPFKHESDDGYDTVEWAASLNYSNGDVGMFGGSYVGATQMLASVSKPPHLKAIFPYVTASEYYDGWTYQNGALMQWFASSWTSSLAEDTLRKMVSSRQNPKDWVGQLPVEDYRLISAPTAQEVAPYFRDWVEHERDDEYWRRWKISDHYSEMNVKALHAGGWHDIFLKGSIKNFVEMRKKAATQEARDGQRLLLGPWAHAGTSSEGKIGDVVFGKQAVLDMNATIIKWADFALKGVKNEFAGDTPVRIFVMGDNVWRDEKDFPLARTQNTRYYFHSHKGANSVSGDGELSTKAPPTEKADTYVYDPHNPTPTIGGRLCCGAGIPPGPFDQSPNESRQDILVFSSPPLERDTEVTGYITVELYASTSAPDTDFTAMIVDAGPAEWKIEEKPGYARFLTDGVVRARYRNSTERAEPIEPGKVYKYVIDLWATSNVFKAGHRIRVYISSSNFPRFNRNLNTGEPAMGATKMIKANQTIYHDSDHPSAIVLPIIPR
ncbi:MAG: CocE/NonD family hydrolase [Chloracidobacterium sp.]|nr:CocE/NonD family hydrolase [Chloracidobacterium sp.]